jgi:hypothetical protein
VECLHGSLGRRVINNTRWSNEAGHACKTDNVTLIRLDHGWHEFLDHPEVTDDVDGEYLCDPFVGRLQQRMRLADSRIVNQNRWISPDGSDGACCFLYRVWRCDIAVEVFDPSVFRSNSAFIHDPRKG